MPKQVVISGIGRSRASGPGATYQKAEYHFNGQSYPPTTLFADVLRSVYQADMLVIFGTRTSSWAALLDSFTADPVAAALTKRLEEDGALEEGVSDNLLDELARYLQPHWEVEVNLKALSTREIGDQNATQVLNAFVSLLLELPTDTQIAFDVTFSLRSLQMLAVSALQICEGFIPGFFSRVTIIYADLRYGVPTAAAGSAVNSRGDMVELGSVRLVAQAAHAASVFEQSLNPAPMVELLKRDGKPSLAERLRHFGLTIANNRFDDLPQALDLLADELQAFDAAELAYGQLLKQRLMLLTQQLRHPTLFATLTAFSEQRAARNDYALAIFALFEGIVSLAVPQMVEDYETIKQEMIRLRSCLSPAENAQLQQLEYARNLVAHGMQRIKNSELLDPITTYQASLAFVKTTDWATIVAKLRQLQGLAQPSDLPGAVVVDLQTTHLPSVLLSGLLPLIRTTSPQEIYLPGVEKYPAAVLNHIRSAVPDTCRVHESAAAGDLPDTFLHLRVCTSSDAVIAKAPTLDIVTRLRSIRSKLAPLAVSLNAQVPPQFTAAQLVIGITECWLVLDQLAELYSPTPHPEYWEALPPKQRFDYLHDVERDEAQRADLHGTRNVLNGVPLSVLQAGITASMTGNTSEHVTTLPATLPLLRALFGLCNKLLSTFLRRTGRMSKNEKFTAWLNR